MLRSITFRPSPSLLCFGLLALACASEDPDPTVDTMQSGSSSMTAPTVSVMPTMSAMPTASEMPTTVPTIDPNSPDAVPWGDVYFIVNMSCGRVICHVPAPNGASTLDLSDINNDQHMLLMTTHVPQCDGDPLVTPGDPSKSALIKLVKKECGAFVMPQDCLPADATCLPQADIDTLSKWITQGAVGPMMQ
jgi:hypothetical protein